MRYSLLLLVLICFCVSNTIGQNAYYDAQVLSGKLKRSASGKIVLDDTARNILNNYYPSGIPVTTNRDTVNVFFLNNPFFANPLDSNTSIFLPQGVAGATGFKYASLVSRIGGLDVTNIADGLARFLIKRGKQELSISFFQRLKDFLDSNVEARTLFPATSKFLGNILAFQYSEFLQALREAFYKDVSNLIVNLNLLIDLPKYQRLLQALPEIRLAIRSAKIVSELSQPDSSLHPANLISRFANLNEWGEMNINLASSWRVLDKISESVRRMDAEQTIEENTSSLTKDSFITRAVVLTENVSRIDSARIAKGTTLVVKSVRTKLKPSTVAWIRFSDFQENILNDDATLRIYLGLLYEKMRGIGFRDAINKDISVQNFMRDNRDNILRLADLVENFLVLANDVEKSVIDIREKKGSGFTSDDYYTYIQKAINVVDYGFKVANAIKEGIADDRYIIMARNAADLYKNIYTKNYNAAIMNAYGILEEVLTKSKEALAEKNLVMSNGVPANRSREMTNFRTAAATVDNENFFDPEAADKRMKLVEAILKYGNVIAGIVKAETPEEAEAAIEAAVLPAGSSSIKKNSDWNVSLNAYIGGYFARHVNNTNEIDGSSSSVGVTAPVGIAFSKGLGRYRNGASVGSLSLYGTLIDVGAVAGYRLSNDSSALEQKVTLSDIFTPGGYLVYGIGLPFKWLSYMPISVGYGWQYGSKLYYRKNDGKLALSDASRWRSNWFVAVDIPLANFWTKQFRKK